MRSALVMLAMAAVACGGGTSGGGSSGTPAGTTLLVRGGSLPLIATDATAVFGSSTCQVGGAPVGAAYAVLVASNQTGMCGYLQRNEFRANARSIELIVARVDPTSTTTTLAPGTYPILPSPTLSRSYATLAVAQNDAACTATAFTGINGAVIVTSTADGAFQGSITATLSDGGTVTGAFDAATCAAALGGDICTGSIGLSNPSCAP